MQDKISRIKKGDTVMVITGKDVKRTGKILRIITKNNSVLVEGLNMSKRHVKARGNQAGGIEMKESPIHISNVLLYCEKCAKPVRTRKSLLADGEKSRTCIKCGFSFDK